MEAGWAALKFSAKHYRMSLDVQMNMTQGRFSLKKVLSTTPYAQVYHSTGETLGYAMGPCASCATYGDSTAQVTQDVKDRM